MKTYGDIPLACGKTEEIHKLHQAISGCFIPPFIVEDIKENGTSVLYVQITNPNIERFENYFRPSMVYVIREFIKRYGLSCDGGEYHGYVEPDPKNLATFSQRTIEDCIKWKDIDNIFGKGSQESGSSMQ